MSVEQCNEYNSELEARSETYDEFLITHIAISAYNQSGSVIVA